jgi:hypothetical protein
MHSREAFDYFRRNHYQPSGEAKIVEAYDYGQWRLQFQVVRMEPKTFRQRQPTRMAKMEPRGSNKGVHNLPRVLAPQVCVTEGERDANTLNKHGLVATTNAGGSERWLDAYSETLRGKDVLVFGIWFRTRR